MLVELLYLPYMQFKIQDLLQPVLQPQCLLSRFLQYEVSGVCNSEAPEKEGTESLQVQGEAALHWDSGHQLLWPLHLGSRLCFWLCFQTTGKALNSGSYFTSGKSCLAHCVFCSFTVVNSLFKFVGDPWDFGAGRSAVGMCTVCQFDAIYDYHRV